MRKPVAPPPSRRRDRDPSIPTTPEESAARDESMIQAVRAIATMQPGALVMMIHKSENGDLQVIGNRTSADYHKAMLHVIGIIERRIQPAHLTLQ